MTSIRLMAVVEGVRPFCFRPVVRADGDVWLYSLGMDVPAICFSEDGERLVVREVIDKCESLEVEYADPNSLDKVAAFVRSQCKEEIILNNVTIAVVALTAVCFVMWSVASLIGAIK